MDFFWEDEEFSRWSFTFDGVTYLMDADGETLIKCSSSNCNLTIHPFVKNIGDDVFRDNKELESITIPESVKSIGKNVFKGCSKLKEVNFDGELLEIKEGTFEDCTSLSTFICPKGVKKIGDSAFRNCVKLEYIYLPSSVTYFDPNFSVHNECRFRFGDWIMPTLNNDIRFGYSNYDEIAKNIHDACLKGLESLENECVSSAEVLPMPVPFFDVFSNNLFVDFFGGKTVTNDKIVLYTISLCKIIANSDEKEVYSKVISKFNDVCYTKNVDYLVETLGVNSNDFSELVVTGNNYNLLNCSIRDFFENYKYLCDQKLISERVLKEIYFGDALGNTPEEMLKDYYKKHGEFPDLFNSLLIEHNDKNKMELRDRLVYVSTMHMLDDGFSKIQLDKAKEKMKFSLVENVINRDKTLFIDSDIYNVLVNKYPEMCGIMYSLKEKMTGIDEQWFYSLLKEIKKGGKDTTFDKFYKSLTVIQHWDEYGETERLTLLKNEIVGRLLYADIALTYKKTDASINKFINKRRNNLHSMQSLLKFSSKSRDELFTKELEIPIIRDGRETSEKIYSRINFILTMLEIDPYSFDALRNAPNEQSKPDCLQSVFAAFANKSGYLFSNKEIDEFLNLVDKDSQEKFLKEFRDYNSFSTQFGEDVSVIFHKGLLTRNDQKTFSEFISNVICNAKIPKEMESKYLDYVRELSASFLSSKSDDELFKFCGALDLYLRSKSEYDIQSADEGKTCAAVEVFDRKSNVSSDARILYSLHNLNRLAHDAVEIDLKSILDQRYRLDRAKAKDSYKKLTRILTAYNDLFHMGFSYETVLHLAKKDSDEIWAGLEEYIEDEDKKKTLTGQIKELSDKRNANMNEGTFGAMVDFSLAKSKVQLAFNNARMFLEDNLSVRRRKSLATFNYELYDKSKKVDFEKLRTIKKKLSIIRDTFNADGSSNLTDEERELIETTAKPKSYFFESKKLFAQEIMNRISMGFSDNFSSMLGATYVDKLNFYSENGYVAEIQDDEHGNPVLVCLCEQFNEPFGIHLQDLPKFVEVQLSKCERTKTIAYAKLDRRGLTLRGSDFDSIMSRMSSSDNFVGFRNYDELSKAIKSNYDNYDVPAKRIRAAMARQSSRSELDGMFSDGANNASGANINTGGNKHQ